MGEVSFLLNTQIHLPLEREARRRTGFLFFFFFRFSLRHLLVQLIFVICPCLCWWVTPAISRGLRKAQSLPPPPAPCPLTSLLGHTVVLCPALARVAACRCHCHPDNQQLLLWQSLNITTQRKILVFIRPGWFLRTQLGLGSLILTAQTWECECLAPVSKPYCQQRGAVFDFFFFNSSVDHVSRQQCAHSTRHRIWQAKQPASYLSLVQMTDFSVHRQFRIIWRFYFESNWRIFFSRTFSSPWYFTFYSNLF